MQHQGGEQATEVTIMRHKKEIDELQGKTISSVKLKKHDEGCDSWNVLRFTMSDGSVYEIEGTYGGHTGLSCDEYIELISVRKCSVAE